MADPVKKPWLSKTLWVNLIGAASAMFFPPVGDFISSNPEIVMVLWSGINMLLRLVTKGAVSIQS